MKTTMKFVKANQSQKNGKTYVEVLNPNTFSKTIHELEGQASVNGLSQGNDVEVLFTLGGDGFKHIVTIASITKKA